MARIILENWLVRIRWHVTCLGTIGKTGAGLLVLTLVFFMAAVLPQQQTLKELKNRVQTVQQQEQPDSVRQAGLSDSQALQVFYDFLPRSDSSPYWISELDRIARDSSVELNSSDYRLTMEKESKLIRYEIQLPLRGTYPQIRAFLAEALQAMPTLALADIAIKRETVQTGCVEARLNMYLYLNDY